MPAERRALQLEVSLDHVKPRIWRRIVVDGDTTLAQLHAILQIALGWQDSHLHAFVIHGQRFGLPDPDDYVPVVDERKHMIGARVSRGHSFQYEYDFGDGWTHTMKVEEYREADPSETLPRCLDGARACPPEDCGGPPGYEELLKALRAKRPTERGRELLEWIGGSFDADAFDVRTVNADLAELVRPRKRRAKSRLH